MIADTVRDLLTAASRGQQPRRMEAASDRQAVNELPRRLRAAMSNRQDGGRSRNYAAVNELLRRLRAALRGCALGSGDHCGI